jgi:2-dehydro-3-deoxygluconokinase
VTRVAVLGECMIELTHVDERTLALGYAGDVYNVAVALARWGTDVSFVSRVGDDHHSEVMVAAWRAEGLDTSLVDRLPGFAPGLYLIRTDEDGERSFTYWRSESPARQLLADDEHAARVQAGLDGVGWLFLSGISLSLLTRDAHARLLALLDAMRADGTRVAFDSNFRPAGWDDARTARRRMDDVLARTTLALPTFDDERALHADADATETARRLERLGVEEAAIKLGADGAVLLADGRLERVRAERDIHVVDTTGAGDAFDAGYLHARIAGHDPAEAGRAGACLAAAVLGHRGAIVPRAVMPSPPRPSEHVTG